MKFGVDFDGVKVEVETNLDDSVRDVVKKALATIFPPGASPAVDGCVTSLCGKRVDLGVMVSELDVPEGHLLSVTLPF
jgi:hypothetical protein